MRYPIPTLAIFLALWAGDPALLSADGQVIVTGSARRSQLPQVLRVRLELTADGSDIAAALAALDQQKAAVVQQLKAAGAIEQSIRFDETQRRAAPKSISKTSVSSPFSRRERATAEPVRVVVQLCADWWLAARSQGELLVAADRIQQQISDTLTTGASTRGGGAHSSAISAQPQFSYVGWLSEQDRAVLIRQACEDARHRAGLWAAATGQDLGSVQEL